MEKHLHIISFDVPYPADYGGVVDVFYKIKMLHQLNVKIHLHCYEYGRGQQLELNNFCTEIKYYQRLEGHKGFSTKFPYIVCSRSNSDMIENLLMDDYPILLEGIHCTYLLNDDRFKNRKIILRLHNAEYEYYNSLRHSEKSFFKKIYYWRESIMLKKYEKSICNKTQILAMSQQDINKYDKTFSAKNISYLPAFSPFQKVKSKNGTGCFCLYHGNLSVSENEAAAIWLLENVFNELDVPFVIAGKNPSANLERMAHNHKQTCLVSNPSEEEMEDMISKAQINILPSFNNTGIKLKLLNALYNGRHCIVNEQTVKSTGLESLCHVASGKKGCKNMINELYERPFHADEILQRENILSTHFNNEKNGKQLIEYLW